MDKTPDPMAQIEAALDACAVAISRWHKSESQWLQDHERDVLLKRESLLALIRRALSPQPGQGEVAWDRCDACNGTLEDHYAPDQGGCPGFRKDVPAPPVPPAVVEGCLWEPEDDPDVSWWNTSCGQAWSFTTDGPKENGMNFCHYCGKPLRLNPEPTNG